MSDTELREKGIALLNELFSFMDVNAEIEAVENEGEEPRLKIICGDAGRLIGRGGQTLESLEMILNRILRKDEEKGEHFPWISLEIDGYHVNPPKSEGKSSDRKSRLPFEEVERLQAMAKDIAREVKKLGMPRVIGPFSPSERRIIHLALEKDTEVETVSDAVADERRCKKITVRLIEK